jgi:hypothetical protein
MFDLRWPLMCLLTVFFLSGAGGQPGNGVAMAADRTERVSFAPGRSSRTVNGSISGRDGIDYVVRVRAGQRLAAVLRTNNPSNYINIKPLGSDSALFIGSTSGNLGDVIVPSSGDYVVEVYLMRNAARRGERADFSLKIEVTGGGPAPVQPDFADGLQGGPDFWEVANVSAGDRLNVRSQPSAQSRIIARLRNGTVLRNLGCRTTGPTRWCRVERPDGSAAGWAAGRFLIESGG